LKHKPLTFPSTIFIIKNSKLHFNALMTQYIDHCLLLSLFTKLSWVIPTRVWELGWVFLCLIWPALVLQWKPSPFTTSPHDLLQLILHILNRHDHLQANLGDSMFELSS
jgi:hypothetical protein